MQQLVVSPLVVIVVVWCDVVTSAAGEREGGAFVVGDDDATEYKQLGFVIQLLLLLVFQFELVVAGLCNEADLQERG